MRLVLVEALKSFDNTVKGEHLWLPMDERTAHLIVMYYLRLLWDPAWEDPCPSPE